VSVLLAVVGEAGAAPDGSTVSGQFTLLTAVEVPAPVEEQAPVPPLTVDDRTAVAEESFPKTEPMVPEKPPIAEPAIAVRAITERARAVIRSDRGFMLPLLSDCVTTIDQSDHCLRQGR
jgi:hypothetical protein